MIVTDSSEELLHNQYIDNKIKTNAKKVIQQAACTLVLHYVTTGMATSWDFVILTCPGVDKTCQQKSLPKLSMHKVY